ncbi:hypothetical protein GCM10025868_34930 [Angustibacter aerolatus]|uniref:FAD-dependent oxidoreductase 2 FAD-binding domain-containing protein n=1 Tax=Angustibacter aerolatus TaxID=1162965 RepID=A0ABQ6JJ63_9ACTN|nr:hypothetical protein GCM10025868_34930 [Angustibacter aerolatus]
MPVYPTAHYAMGGVPTNVQAEVLSDNTTVVPGLYAAGEVACVSVHGSNRLGTNSLLDINVFGRRAGIAAAEFARTAPLVDLPEAPEADTVALLQRMLDRPDGERVAAVRKEPAGDDGPQRPGVPHRGVAEAGPRRHPGAAGALPHGLGAGQGQAVQHRPARGRRASASCSTSPR